MLTMEEVLKAKGFEESPTGNLWWWKHDLELTNTLCLETWIRSGSPSVFAAWLEGLTWGWTERAR